MLGERPVIFGICALAVTGLTLLEVARSARSARRQAAGDPHRATDSVYLLGKKLGTILGLVAGCSFTLLYLPGHEAAGGWLPAYWTIALAASCAIYFGGLWIALSLERSIQDESWRTRSRLRIVVALASPTWLPLVWGALGPLAATPLSPPSWTDGIWIPLGILYTYCFYGLVSRIGHASPLPAAVASAYAELSQLAPSPATRLLDTGDAKFANALACWSPTGQCIYLTDVLTERLSAQEAAAILLHEEGHVAHRHVPIRLAFALLWQGCAVTLLLFVGALDVVSAAVAYVIFTALVMPRISQRGERAADAYAAQCLGEPKILGRALAKLHAAAHLPDEWKGSKWAHSHPDLVSRLEDLHMDSPIPADSEGTA